MKKTLLIAAIAMFGLSNAQMEKGSWVFGATSNLGFSTAKTTVESNGQSQDAGTTSEFSFNPSTGYFVKDKLAVGLDVGLSNVNYKNDGYENTVQSFSILPTATYYFYNDKNIVPYLGVGIGYGSVTTKYTLSNIDYLITDFNSTTTVDGLSLKGKGGVVILLNKHIGVDAGLSYEHFSADQSAGNNTAKLKVGNFGVNAGFTIFLGGESNEK